MLHDLMDTLPLPERYSYEFEGNARVLDHISSAAQLFARPFVFDPVHVNAEFFDQASDHDPSVVRLALNEAPTVEAGGPYSAAEGGSVGLAATGNDAEGGTPALRLGSRQQRHLRDRRPDTDVLCGNPRRSLDANGRRSGHRRRQPDRHRHRDDHDHERRAHGHVHRACDRLRGLPALGWR